MSEVGKEIEPWCGQCKTYRRSAVTSLGPDGAIDRVTCLYCQTARNYKPPKTSDVVRGSRENPQTVQVREFTVPEDELRALIHSVIREETEPATAEMLERWRGGTLVIKSGKPGLQDKEIPVEQFFHKIVMLRDRLRVLEQQINSNEKLTDAGKVALQQYITRCYGTLTTFNIFFKEKSDHFVGAKS